MKHITYLLAIILLCISTMATGENKKRNNVSAIPIQAKVVGDSVQIKMIIELKRKRVNLCTSIVFTPVITYKNIREVLPEIVITGRNNYSLIKRNPIFNTYKERDEKLLFNYNSKEYKVIKNSKIKKQMQIIYSETIKNATWLKDAKIDIYQTIMRCNKEITTEHIYTGEKIKVNPNNN